MWGRIGCGVRDEASRFWILHVGFLANVIGCLLTAYACFAISDKFGYIQSAAFSSAKIQETEGRLPLITVDLGLRAAALNNPKTVGEKVILFSDFCTYAGAGLQQYFHAENCNSCSSFSTSMVTTLVVSAVTFVPSFATDILRMYSNYDVNCQKTVATFMTIISILLSLNTLLSYDLACYTHFYQGIIPFDANGNPLASNVSPSSVSYYLNFDWKMGPGLICLWTGTFCKAVNIVSHLLIPTPTITRDVFEQANYEQFKKETA